MQNRSAWAQPLATLPKYKENLQTWQPRAVKLKKKKEISEWSSGVESRVKPWVSDWLFRFVHVSPLFVCHPVPWPELKGHLGVQESFLNHVCECWYGSLDPAEGARGRFTPHDQERWRPFPRQPIFPSLCFPPHPSAQAVLAPVQFNFSRAHRLVLSPSDPSVSPPRKKRLSYFLPL